MRKSVRETEGCAAKDEVRQTLSILENALDLLADYAEPLPQSKALQVAPLPSLLQQLQEVLETPWHGPSVRVVFVMPGLPVLAPEWWGRRCPALACYQVSPLGAALPVPRDAAGRAEAGAMAAAVRSLIATAAQAGKELLFTVELSSQNIQGFPDVEAERLCLVGHPWRAFRALLRQGRLSGLSLEQFCSDWLSALEGIEPSAVLRLEELGATSPQRESVLADRLDLELRAQVGETIGGSEELTGEEIWRTWDDEALPSGVLAAQSPAYLTLCERLGYRATDEALPDLAVLQNDCDVRACLWSYVERAQVLRAAPAGRGIAALQPMVAGIDDIIASGETDFLERLDAFVSTLSVVEAPMAVLLASAHFMFSGDRVQALSLVSEALDLIPEGHPETHGLRMLACSLYLDLGASREAFEAAVRSLRDTNVLGAVSSERLSSILAPELRSPTGHGHVLLLDYLRDFPLIVGDRQPVMIEIGTTRENVPGQGSTRLLAQACAELGIKFITVDMDPRNIRNARNMFRRLGLPFEAYTARGEDFLAQYDGEIDIVFLDAYDFDHGMHSEQRQARYEQYMGQRIEDTECHRMHLDCAKTLVERLAPDGVICFDDTWVDEAGEWMAKGKTAMPYLLSQGFELLDVRNRAALLRRSSNIWALSGDPS